MLSQQGRVTPVVMAFKAEDESLTQIWEMVVSQAMTPSGGGLEAVVYTLGRLVSDSGCDLSQMGVKREHCKVDVALLVAEGIGAREGQESVRTLLLDCCGMGMAAAALYRIDQAAPGGFQIRLMGPVPSATLHPASGAGATLQ